MVMRGEPASVRCKEFPAYQIAPVTCKGVYHSVYRKQKEQKSPVKQGLSVLYGGEPGIRTLGTLAGTTDFESVPFDHSGNSPSRRA